MNIREENNRAKITGEVINNFTFSHEAYGEKFFTTTVRVPRLSSTWDIIPVMVSDKLVDVSADWVGSWIRITGQFRSNNKRQPDGRTKLELFVFALTAEPVTDWKKMSAEDVNSITLDGYFCKKPIWRKTPLGRYITDVLVAVNRAYNKSDYIPCICWGRNASYASRFDVGTHCVIEGRIQSRAYMKTLENGSTEERMAWEISVQTIQLD